MSWYAGMSRQQAYQLQVASSRELLESDEPDLWDSGRVESGRSVQISYRGLRLKTRQWAYWRVRVWSSDNSAPSEWSEIGGWRASLLSEEDWSADWIRYQKLEPVRDDPLVEEWVRWAGTVEGRLGAPDVAQPALRATPPASYLKRIFRTDTPVVNATLYSTSAGYSEFSLNGQKIGDRLYNPAQTDFDKRIFYDADDVKSLLVDGENTLAAHLGNGFYAERTAFNHKPMFFGEPAIIAELHLEYADGTTQVVKTDGSWIGAPSPVVKNGVYSGEVFDARRADTNWWSNSSANLQDWGSVDVLDDWPTDNLVRAVLPPVREVKKVLPKAIREPEPGVFVFDFGQNFTGRPVFNFEDADLQRGQSVIFRYAEWADDSYKISTRSGGGFATRTDQVDSFISDGKMTSWAPSFTWHGFRYIEVRGLTERPPLSFVEAHLTRTDVPTTGKFLSSDAHLNRIHDTALWTFESNLVSVPMDCPIRERNGWTGDAHASLLMSNYNFGMAGLWEKYLGDFRTSAQVAPSIVPGRRSFGLKVDWAAAEVLIAWQHYVFYGDASILADQYDHLQEYVDFIKSVPNEYIFEAKPHIYGDWFDPSKGHPRKRAAGERGESIHTPAELTATAVAYRVFDRLSLIADILGYEEDRQDYIHWAENIKDAFNARFLDRFAKTYGSQTANALALSYGLAPTDMRADIAMSLNLDVVRNWGGHTSAGPLGQTWVYPALSRAGFGDVALGVFHAKGYPGFHYLFDELNGTSLWEAVSEYDPGGTELPERSLSHPFKGGYDAWFFSDLGGIQPDESEPAFKHFFLRPTFPTELDWVDTSLETGYGNIGSSWKRQEGTIVWNISVPLNTSATVQGTNSQYDGVEMTPGDHTLVLNAQ